MKYTQLEYSLSTLEKLKNSTFISNLQEEEREATISSLEPAITNLKEIVEFFGEIDILTLLRTFLDHEGLM